MSRAKGYVFFLAGMILFFCGCGSPCYFDLQTDAPEKPAGWRIAKVLLVEDAEISETYRDYRIVSRESPFRVKYHGSAAWSRSPDELIEDAVALFWRQSAVFKKVETHGGEDDPDWALRIRVDAIERYRDKKNWQARLALDVEIVNFENKETVLVHSFDRRAALARNRIRLLPETIARILHEELLKIEAKLQKMAQTENEGPTSSGTGA